jgi:hypothetical protein
MFSVEEEEEEEEEEDGDWEQAWGTQEDMLIKVVFMTCHDTTSVT